MVPGLLIEVASLAVTPLVEHESQGTQASAVTAQGSGVAAAQL